MGYSSIQLLHGCLCLTYCFGCLLRFCDQALQWELKQRPATIMGGPKGHGVASVSQCVTGEGFAPEEIGKISVPKIPDRLALLNSGELEAAMLPDPASFIAIGNGAVNVLDDSSHPEFGYSTIAFRKAVLDNQPEAVRAFLAAVEKAVELINEDPGRWNKLLSEKQIVPEPVSGSYQINPYPTGSVPTELQYQDVLLWAQDKGLVDKDVPYSRSINPAYLP